MEESTFSVSKFSAFKAFILFMLSIKGMAQDPITLGVSSGTQLVEYDFTLHGGDGVGNGGGLVEGFLAKASVNIENIILTALAYGEFNEQDKMLLTKIMQSVEEEKENKPFIIISNDNSLFTIEGIVKVAKTGSNIGDAIYINFNQVYQKDSLGFLLPNISFGGIIKTLVHELGHHHGENNHLYLDVLGAEVAKHGNIQESYISENSESFDFENSGFSGQPPANMYLNNRGYKIVVDNTESRRGQNSVKITALATARFRYGGMNQCAAAAPFKGKTLRFVSHIKSSAIFYGAGPWMVYYNSQGMQLFYDDYNTIYTLFNPTYQWNRLIRGTQDWTEHSIQGYVPEQTEYICFGVNLYDEGTVWTDSWSLEVQ